MAKLSDFQRLETHGVWRDSATDPGRRVVVLLDEKFLTFVSMNNRPLTHWSIDAVRRINPGELPAHYTPDESGDERIELADELFVSVLQELVEPKPETTDAAEPQKWPGRAVAAALVLAVFCGLILASDRIAGGMAGLVPAAERLEIGDRILAHLTEIAGPECQSAAGNNALSVLERRLFDGGKSIRVIRGMPQTTAHLPGNILILSGAVLARNSQTAAVAGHLLQEYLRAEQADSMAELLRFAGIGAAVKLTFRDSIDDEMLRRFAETLIGGQPAKVSESALLEQFQRAGFPSSPFARATRSLGLLLAKDPYKGRSFRPLLNDNAWFDLKGICQVFPNG